MHTHTSYRLQRQPFTCKVQVGENHPPTPGISHEWVNRLFFLYSMTGKGSLRKIIKIVATICHILKLKCTKFDFGWGAYSAPQTH